MPFPNSHPQSSEEEAWDRQHGGCGNTINGEGERVMQLKATALPNIHFNERAEQISYESTIARQQRRRETSFSQDVFCTRFVSWSGSRDTGNARALSRALLLQLCYCDVINNVLTSLVNCSLTFKNSQNTQDMEFQMHCQPTLIFKS